MLGLRGTFELACTIIASRCRPFTGKACLCICGGKERAEWVIERLDRTIGLKVRRGEHVEIRHEAHLTSQRAPTKFGEQITVHARRGSGKEMGALLKPLFF